jgi:hypothetical protein
LKKWPRFCPIHDIEHFWIKIRLTNAYFKTFILGMYILNLLKMHDYFSLSYIGLTPNKNFQMRLKLPVEHAYLGSTVEKAVECP